MNSIVTCGAIVLDETDCVNSHTQKVHMRSQHSTTQHNKILIRIREISKDHFDAQRIDLDQLKVKSV
jgi:hypothetical protein